MAERTGQSGDRSVPSPLLFTPYSLRGLELRNRLMLAPMNQHAATGGFADDGMLVHLGKYALGGFGVVATGATAVTPSGKIGPGDLGIWSDEHVSGFKRLTAYIRGKGAASAIQICHSGRKGSIQRPWHGFGPIDQSDIARNDRPWPLFSPTSEALGPGHVVPHALDEAGVRGIIEDFSAAAVRADKAGFDILEIHGGHGYLIASFLSPVINTRTDRYGGDLCGRMRFALELVESVRRHWPERKPLFFRASCVDGHPDGWKLEDTVLLATQLKQRGVDLIDCSSGGLRVSTSIENTLREPGYQVAYAAEVRRRVGIPTGAVGLILDGVQAEGILQQGAADLIIVGRQALYDPYFAHHAAQVLGVDAGFDAWDASAGWWLAKRRPGLEALGLHGSGKSPHA